MPVIYGVNPVLETLRGRPGAVERVLVSASPRLEQQLKEAASGSGVRVERVDRARLEGLAPGAVHQGVVAQVKEFEVLELDALVDEVRSASAAPLLVVLDGIQDPHNLGAIIRSAHALGAHGVITARDRAAPLTGAVVKASAGALSLTRMARVTNISRALEALKEAGFWSVALDPEGDRAPWDVRLDGPTAVVVGAEGPGIRKGVLGHCDFRVRIPMAGQVASLNASVSAAILLYEVARSRRDGAKPANRP